MTKVEILLDAMDQDCFDEFTLEMAQGETYSSMDWAVYAHGEYEDYSVLAGRRRRCFVCSFDSKEEAQKAIQEAKMPIDGESFSTHVPVDVVTSHLPGDCL